MPVAVDSPLECKMSNRDEWDIKMWTLQEAFKLMQEQYDSDTIAELYQSLCTYMLTDDTDTEEKMIQNIRTIKKLGHIPGDKN